MKEPLTQAKAVQRQSFPFDFSICTLVNNQVEYREMLASFDKAGFSTTTCEFLYIDNTRENTLDAYSGLNLLLQQAQGKYVILCHQDILLKFDNRERLEQRISELAALDPKWAVAANAGAAGPNHIVYKVAYPDGTVASKGKFPLLAQSLDEHFLLVRNGCGLSFSDDLVGFHLYGTDICLQAAIKGYNSYVIDFLLLHKSKGNPDHSFSQCQKNLVEKYNRCFRSRWVQTTVTSFYLSGTSGVQLQNNPVSLFGIRMWNGLKKRLK
jgi:hypothetical protein